MQTQAIQLRPYGYIYKLTNKINGKCYIGQSINIPEIRWQKYRHLQCKQQIKLYNALKKYGPTNFTYEIITIGSSKNNLDFLEDVYELHYDSINNGYNIRRGGSHGKHSNESKIKISNAFKGKKHSQEHRIKNSKSHIGIKASDIRKINMSKSLSGANHPMFGKVRSLKSNIKTSETMKGRILTEDHKHRISLAAKIRWAKRKQLATP